MSTWKLDERCKTRNYSDPNEREAFGWGYSDGWHNKPKNSSCEEHYFPNAYSAGYWEGVGDSPLNKVRKSGDATLADCPPAMREDVERMLRERK